MSETEKNERIAELETTSAKLLAEVRRLEKAGTELERIAAHRLDELVDLRARVLELEPLAEVGRRALDVDGLAQIIRFVDGNNSLGAGVLAEMIGKELRAAGIGEKVWHGN